MEKLLLYKSGTLQAKNDINLLALLSIEVLIVAFSFMILLTIGLLKISLIGKQVFYKNQWSKMLSRSHSWLLETKLTWKMKQEQLLKTLLWSGANKMEVYNLLKHRQRVIKM